MAPPEGAALRFVERGTEEWLYLWGRLRREYGSAVQCHPRSGERWQYMGTAYYDRHALWLRRIENETPGWFHEFRHRMHASSRIGSAYWRCRATDSYQSFEDYRLKQSRPNRYV